MHQIRKAGPCSVLFSNRKIADLVNVDFPQWMVDQLDREQGAPSNVRVLQLVAHCKSQRLTQCVSFA